MDRHRKIWPVLGALAVIAVAPAVSHAREAQMTEPQAAATAPNQLYVFLYSAGPAWMAGLPMERQALGSHAGYIKGLLDEGRLVGGGRFEGLDGGMAIVRAASLEEAQATLAADPAIVSGVFVAELRAWTPRFRSPEPLP
jgi:uncharacterized protein YciI